MICRSCARRCGALRTDQEGKGYCRMPLAPVLARAALHYGEEPCISGTKGSGTVFFSGCNLHCVFCQNNKISHHNEGIPVTVERLAAIFRELEQAGAHNINLVTPSHYTDAIRAALKLYRPAVPIVYNAGGYDTPETIESLKNDIDVFLLDFKFWSEDRAMRYASAPHYRETAQENILAAANAVERQMIFDENGIIQRGLIVRHLILPQGTADAIRIVSWCNEQVPFAGFSLMSQYLPCGRAPDFPEINRTITPRERRKVLDRLETCDFSLMYDQSITSATDAMIPDFDLTGIKSHS